MVRDNDKAEAVFNKGVTRMHRTTLLDRRRLLLSLMAAGAWPACGAMADTGAGPMTRTLIVAGPAGSRLDRWADLIAGPIGQALPAHVTLVRQNVGGLDGVTGANRFEARGEPDGSTALLVPGSAALSWLVGESRVKFDPARWVPLWASTSSAVLVSRVTLVPGRALAVAASGPAGPELPALIALDLMGSRPVLSVPALADAMLVQGPPAAVEAAAAAGYRPVMTLGVVDDDGRRSRDPFFPSIPTALELLQAGAPVDMVGALRATSLAVQLEAALVLPPLTPSAPVALWRHACAGLSEDPALIQSATQRGIHLLAAAKAASCTDHIAGSAEALLALRRWLATRYNWIPT